MATDNDANNPDQSADTRQQAGSGKSFLIGAGMGAGTYILGGMAITVGLFAAFMVGGLAMAASAAATASPVAGVVAGIVVGAGTLGGIGYGAYKLGRAAYRAITGNLKLDKGLTITGAAAGFLAAIAIMTPHVTVQPNEPPTTEPDSKVGQAAPAAAQAPPANGFVTANLGKSFRASNTGERSGHSIPALPAPKATSAERLTL